MEVGTIFENIVEYNEELINAISAFSFEKETYNRKKKRRKEMILIIFLSIYVLISCTIYMFVLSINAAAIILFTCGVFGLIYALVYLTRKIDLLFGFRKKIVYQAVYRLTKKIHGKTLKSIVSGDEIRIIDESSSFQKISRISSFNEYVEYGNYFLIYNTLKSDIETWAISKSGFLKGNVSEFQAFLNQNRILEKKKADID